MGGLHPPHLFRPARIQYYHTRDNSIDWPQTLCTCLQRYITIHIYIYISTFTSWEGEGMTYSKAAVFPVLDTTGATMAIGGLVLLFPGEEEGWKGGG